MKCRPQTCPVCFPTHIQGRREGQGGGKLAPRPNLIEAPQFEGSSKIEQRLPFKLWPTKYSDELASQNAEYGIQSGILDFKIFPRSIPPDPPTLSWYYIPRTLWRNRGLKTFFCPRPRDFSRWPCPHQTLTCMFEDFYTAVILIYYTRYN